MMAAAVHICPRCGKPNAARMRFCVACGAGLSAAAGSPQAQASPGRSQALCGESQISHGESVIDLVRTIARHTGPADDAAQQERIAHLIQLGASTIPAINGAIWSAIRYAGTPAELENAGALCEALGRIGGPQAYATLERLAVHTTASERCRPIYDGVRRGLAALRDERAQVLSTQLESLAQQPPTIEPEAVVGAAAEREAVPTASAATQDDAASRPESRPVWTDPWFWVMAGGALFYLALIVLIFVAPQVSFCAGTILLAPPLFYLVLLRLHASGWIDDSSSGCMLILASLIGGLILYGLLYLFQRTYFIDAFQALMDSGS